MAGPSAASYTTSRDTTAAAPRVCLLKTTSESVIVAIMPRTSEFLTNYIFVTNLVAGMQTLTHS